MFEISAGYLSAVRRKALRSRIWFKVLDHEERAILTLAPKCVDVVRSPRLIDIVAEIIVKVQLALKSPLARFRSQVARPLAEKISLIAQKWGNLAAEAWAADRGFIQYLAVCRFNDISIFK